mmetsp:Transcript_54309/g.116697  ORF Transcript_54309/g.116697 Transcript_54309/m.116697 type:complete len:219 (-) Transcript_54309:454-1110(-)
MFFRCRKLRKRRGRSCTNRTATVAATCRVPCRLRGAVAAWLPRGQRRRTPRFSSKEVTTASRRTAWSRCRESSLSAGPLKRLTRLRLPASLKVVRKESSGKVHSTNSGGASLHSAVTFATRPRASGKSLERSARVLRRRASLWLHSPRCSSNCPRRASTSARERSMPACKDCARSCNCVSWSSTSVRPSRASCTSRWASTRRSRQAGPSASCWLWARP